MHPILIQLGSFALPSWHAMYALGAIVAFLVLVHIAKLHCRLIHPRFFANLFVVSYIAGYFGARLYSLIIEDLSVNSISDVLIGLSRFGSMTFYGGALGAFAAGTIYTLVKRIPVPVVFDVAIPSALIALAIGRVGCFLNGDDFGAPVTILEEGGTPFWAVTFPNLGDGIARYPVQLVSAFAAVTLALLLIRYFARIRNRLGAGAVGYLAVSAYCVGRFVLEFYRGDDRGQFLLGILSPAQLTSTIIIAVVVLTLPFWLNKWRKTPFE